METIDGLNEFINGIIPRFQKSLKFLKDENGGICKSDLIATKNDEQEVKSLIESFCPEIIPYGIKLTEFIKGKNFAPHFPLGNNGKKLIKLSFIPLFFSSVNGKDSILFWVFDVSERKLKLFMGLIDDAGKCFSLSLLLKDATIQNLNDFISCVKYDDKRAPIDLIKDCIENYLTFIEEAERKIKNDIG